MNTVVKLPVALSRLTDSFRVLVCGQRDFVGRDHLFRTLDEIHALRPITCIIEGEARGADTFAREWAISRNVEFDPYPANWTKYGKAAGPIRNTQMLVEGKPDMVVAFYHNPNDSKGTKNMVGQAARAGIATAEYVFARPPVLPSEKVKK